MAKTKIEWATETWNPITGCNKVSEGCKNCYAEKMHYRLNHMNIRKYYHSFAKPIFHPEELDKIPKGKGKIVFVCSMSDLFNENIADNDIDIILHEIKYFIIDAKFVICTKRTERMYGILTKQKPISLGHSIFLASIENQTRYEERMPYLVKIKEMGFNVGISFEPLLGEITPDDRMEQMDWVIVGGETGKGARIMMEKWVYDIFDICKKYEIPFFFKKWGDYKFTSPIAKKLNYRDNGDYIRQYPKGWR